MDFYSTKLGATTKLLFLDEKFFYLIISIFKDSEQKYDCFKI